MSGGGQVSSTPAPPLDLAAFPVHDVACGTETALRDGVLTVDAAALEATATGEQGLVGMEVTVAHPGDRVRVLNVLDAVEPVVKAEQPDATFPGALGKLAHAGVGRTNRLEGAAVLATADLHSAYDLTALDVYPDGDSFVDMSGPGANLTYWSATQNIVLSFSCDPQLPPHEADASIRRVTLRVARDLAVAATAVPPAAVERFDIPPAKGDLPRVCVVLQVASEGPLLDTFLYGRPIRNQVPTLLDPREVLDGALTAGQYDWAGTRDPTYFFQRSRLLLELLHRHGVDLCFCGVILTLAYLPSSFDKERNALMAAGLARTIGADAAVVTTFQSGNSHTDTMLTCRALERLRIRTVLLLAETNGGLTDHLAEADCIVSVGNEEELVPEWKAERALGGESTWTGRPATDAGPVPAVSYLGALCQMGDMKLQAVVS